MAGMKRARYLPRSNDLLYVSYNIRKSEYGINESN